MADAHKSYRKVREVITHDDNNLNHIEAINQLIKNYANKFPEEAVLLADLMRDKCELEENLSKK